MNTPDKSTSRPSRRERTILIAAMLLVVALVIWMIAANPLFQIAYIAGGLVLTVAAVLFATAWRKGGRWFITRNALGFYFWFFAGFLSVVILFYAEEKWRGKRAWAALQAEAAARGESLELASIIPPAVPDKQNFAKAPGVAEVLRFSSNAGSEARPSDEGSAFYHGQARDWPQACWMRQEVTDFAEWQAFLSRHMTSTSGPAVPKLANAVSGKEAATAVTELLKDFDPALEILRAAAERPLARFPIDHTKGWTALSGDVYKIITDLHYAAHALSLRASALVALGDTDAALNDVLLSLRLADTLREEPYLSTLFRRNQMLIFALQPVWEGLANHSWNEAQLRRIQERFAGMDIRADAMRAARGETILTMDMASQLEAYLEGGRTSPMARELSNQKGADAFMAWVFRTFYPSGWLAQDRVWVYRFYQKYGERNWAASDPYLGNHRWQSELLGATDPMLLIWVVPRVVQICGNSIEWGLYLEAVRQQVLTACALERYRLAHGEYPATLGELVPSHLEVLPVDKMASSAPMVYRRPEPDRFILYSIGLNKADDGGEPMPVEDHLYPRFNKGDWVWAYPPNS